MDWRRFCETLNAWLFSAAVALLPFQHYPHGPFSRLSLYPLALLMLLNLAPLLKLSLRTAFLRRTAYGFALCLAGQILIPLLSSAAMFDPGAVVSDAFTYGAIFVLLASFYLFPSGRAQSLFFKAFSFSVAACAAYSVVEILHFCGVRTASAFLSKAIYFFSDVRINGSWWPPELWDSVRLRAFFAEPSGYAILLVFATGYYGVCALASKCSGGFSKCLGMAVLSVLLCCGTRSFAAAITLMFFACSFAAVWFPLRAGLAKVHRRRGWLLLSVFALSSVFAVCSQRGGVFDFEHLLPHLTGVNRSADAGSTSTRTRMLHLQAQMRLVMERPLSGFGASSYAPAMCRELAESDCRTSEIDMWIERGDVPPLNFLGYTSVRYGVPVLLLLLSAVFLPAASEVVSRWRAGMGETSSLVCASSLPLLSVALFMNSSSLFFLMGMLLVAPLAALARDEPPGGLQKECGR